MRRAFLFLIVAFAASVRPVAADTVKLRGKPAFQNVLVTGYSDGRVVFRGISKYIIQSPIREVESLAIDAAPDLSAAELHAAAGRWDEAAGAYQQAARDAREGWLADLVVARRVMALDAAGRFGEAVESWLDALRQQTAPDNAIPPRRPGPPGGEANAKAIQALKAARLRGGAERAAQRLLLELLIYEDVAVLPASFGPSKPVDDDSGDSDRDAPPLLFGGRTSRPAQGVRLDADSFLQEAARASIREGAFERAGRMLERAISFTHPAPAEWRVLLARCRIETGAADRALRDLGQLKLAEDRAVQDEALYTTGLAYERLGDAEAARSCYRELMQRPRLSDELCERTRIAQARVGE